MANGRSRSAPILGSARGDNQRQTARRRIVEDTPGMDVLDENIWHAEPLLRGCLARRKLGKINKGCDMGYALADQLLRGSY